ncbi:FLU1-II [Auricularia subglabra TFB-10046 SS5]|nr:FLU1-II [Auricularia subglabra TFB-10046 SS5]
MSSYHSLRNKLEDSGVRYVRLQWVDLINWTRYRVIPIAQFSKLLDNARPGVRLTEATLGLVFLQLAEGVGPSGEYLYVVDPSSVRICGYAKGHATVMGWFERAIPSPALPLSSRLCPRGLLRRVLIDAAQQLDVQIRLGFEVEVIFLKSVAPLQAANDFGWSMTQAMPTGSTISVALEEIANALEGSGIELMMYHAEAAPGQYEFVTGHLPPLEAVDALISTRETIFNIASKHGFKATLAPRLYNDSCGSGLHVHLSVSSCKRTYGSANVPSAPGFSKLEAAFLQGMLDHLPGVCALSLPTEASYTRMLDGIWAGGTWASWGRENRESAIRLCGEEGAYHFEVRAHDGTACPYVAMAALIAGGMRGVRASVPLAAKDCQVAAANLTERQRADLGITQPDQRMPLNLQEARSCLRQDRELVSDLGEDFVQRFLAVNETLERLLKDETEEMTVKKLVDHY